ncbi:MAG: hypothetical protein ACE3L7_07305 [Candidatus Pristimantibacillus sp.]
MSKECLMCDGEKIHENEECSFCEGTGFDLEHTENPVCPHCGHEEEEHAELGLKDWSDGSECVEQCSNCNQKFGLVLSVSYTFGTTKKYDGQV